MIGVGCAGLVDETGLAEKQQRRPCSDVGSVRQIERNSAPFAQKGGAHHHAAHIDGDLVSEERIQNRGTVPNAGIESPADARGARLTE